MPAMMDATCPKCNRRVGWAGEVTDRPPCHRCGHQVTRQELEADRAKFAEMRRLFDLHPSDATPAELIAMRKMAGLSRGQAAKLVGVPIAHVIRWENGTGKPTMPEANKLAEVYGGG